MRLPGQGRSGRGGGGGGGPGGAAAGAGGAVTTGARRAPGPGAAAELAQIAPALDCLLPSLTEARILTGHTWAAECAAALRALGIPTVIIKLGAAGMLAATEEGVISTPAFAVEVVDTTSCGDAFCAGFVAAWSRGLDLAGRIRLGAATAALVAQGLGTLGKLVDFEQMQQAAGTMRLRG